MLSIAMLPSLAPPLPCLRRTAVMKYRSNVWFETAGDCLGFPYWTLERIGVIDYCMPDATDPASHTRNRTLSFPSSRVRTVAGRF